MPRIPYPNVPLAAGVPVVARIAGSTTANPVLGVLSSAIWQAIQNNQQWGIFDKDGKPLSAGEFTGAAGIIANAVGLDSVLSTVSVGINADSRISDFPVERGGFATYNKVIVPQEQLITIAFSGSESQRAELYAKLDKAQKSTDLYSVVVPEYTFKDVNITRWGNVRSAQKGANMLYFDLYLKEIRQVTARFASTSNAKQPSAKPAVNNGIVQAKPRSGSFTQ